MNRESITLNVEGMTCSNCARSVSKVLERDGNENVVVDFSTGEVSYKGDKSRMDNVKQSIQKLGFKVKDEVDSSQHFLSNLEYKLILCSVLTIPLMLHMVVSWKPLHSQYVQLALSLPVFLIGLHHFGKSAWGAVRNGSSNMDVLIIIGATAAFIYSLIGTILNLGEDFLFYETAASIITLVMLGNVIEHRAVAKTTSAIKSLVQLQPNKAKLIQESEAGSEKRIIEVDVNYLKVGQTLLINEGDQIPLDGTIISGEALVDESMISGESIPVNKNIGDYVVGGTVLQSGTIRLELTATAKESVLSKIIDLVKRAQTNKPQIQKLGDRISEYFVPIVLLISMVTFLLGYLVFDLALSQAMLQAVAVLVISCPCAMGLATPTAVMVGVGKAAKQGILFKGGDAIEKLAKADCFVFDKTGTLTTGEFKIKTLNVLKGNQKEIESIIYSLELHSSHPIAKSIVRELGEKEQIEFKNVEEIKGVGVKGGAKGGDEFQIGSSKLLQGENSDHDIYVLKNGSLVATIDIQDEIKNNVSDLMKKLHDQDIETILLSGDKESKCNAIAEKLGIKSYYAEQSPEDKLRVINQLMEKKSVVMVGDGINDAPALAQAHLGISLSKATKIAIESSQVIILNENMLNLYKALVIAKETLKTIKQNLFWAFFYNVLAIPIAALGFLRPMVAALSMAFSDVIVVGNSLLLKVKRLDK